MKVTITIETGNDDCQTESDIARHLHRVAERIECAGLEYFTKITDENGNKIGTVTTEKG